MAIPQYIQHNEDNEKVGKLRIYRREEGSPPTEKFSTATEKEYKKSEVYPYTLEDAKK